MKKFLMIFLTICMVISCMVVPSMALDSPPLMAHTDGWGYIYYTADVDGQTVFKCCEIDSDDVSEIKYFSNDGWVKSDPNRSSYCVWWTYESGSWVKGAYGSSSNQRYISLGTDIYYSNFDILYYGSDEVFFTNPLPSLTETVEELTMEQSMAVQNQTVGVMKILVPCGVGCLALLMALPTLRKGFLRFLH